jgi:UPF0755 protein
VANRKKLIIVLAVFFLIFLSWLLNEVSPVEGRAEKAFIINNNSHFQNLSTKLEEGGFIRNSFFFSLYGNLTGKKDQIIAGEHTLQQGSSYKEIFADLSTLDHETEALEMIIPEGLTVLQIADRLNEKGIVKREEFLKKSKTWKVLEQKQQKKLKLTDMYLIPGTKYAMEGLLFPDTYFFKKKMNAGEVVRQMTDRFIEKTEHIKIKSGLQPYEWVTLASIIEKEALLNKEKPIIAGVFMNRIREGKKLQSCSTVQYLLDKPKARLKRKDIKIKNPYNTYLNKGLPPSPIANPDLASLKAAANPQKNNYYYFVAKQDGTWSHYFSKTYKEHQKYTRLSGNY